MRFSSASGVFSVLGAYLAWSLVCAKCSTCRAHDDMPRLFRHENQNKVPAARWWLLTHRPTVVISTYWSRDAFALMLNLTSAMSLIPYMFVAAFGFMLAQRAETYEVRPRERTRDLIIASIAAVYTFFMIVAGGIKFVLLSALLYAPGTILYFWARRERGKRVFNTSIDWLIFATAVIGCIAAIIGLSTGYLTI